MLPVDETSSKGTLKLSATSFSISLILLSLKELVTVVVTSIVAIRPVLLGALLGIEEVGAMFGRLVGLAVTYAVSELAEKPLLSKSSNTAELISERSSSDSVASMVTTMSNTISSSTTTDVTVVSGNDSTISSTTSSINDGAANVSAISSADLSSAVDTV